MVNSYGPNIDEEGFYLNIQGLMAIDTGPPLVWVGDYNCILDGCKDRSPQKTNTKPQMTKTLKEAVYNLDLCDIWRTHNPERKEFTCYSSTHDTYSRLDRIYISKSISESVTNIQHLARYISYHAPVLMEMSLGVPAHNRALWRLSPEVLLDGMGNNIISERVAKYLDGNWGSTATRANEWEAMKQW